MHFLSSLLLCFGVLLSCCLVHNAEGQVTIDMYWPTGGEARCVNLTDVTTLYPGVVIPPSCETYIIWDRIYVDNNTLARNVWGRITMGGSWSSPACLISNWRWVCTMMFRPCYEFDVPAGYGPVNSTIAVGQTTCNKYCVEAHTDCRGAILASLKLLSYYSDALFAAAISCDPGWDAVWGLPYLNTTMFPNGTYTIPLTADGGNSYFNVTLPCYDGNHNLSAPIPTTLCPEGTYYDGGLCFFNCPEPLLTDSEYDAITIMVSVMGWISIVLSAFLAVTFLMDPDKRKFPAHLSVFFILCIFCLSFAFCLGSMVGWRSIWCDSNDRPNTFGDAACTIQGMTFVYFSLASVLWWLVLSFNLLLMVTRILPHDAELDWPDYFKGLRNPPRGYLRWETLWIGYHIFAWIPPFIPLIISLGAERLGYGGHDIWCTIHSGDQVSFFVDDTGAIQYTGGDAANIWNLVLLIIPILFIVFVGVCILIFVVIWGVWKSGWRFFVQQWRLFLFILFFVWIYTFVFGFQIDLAVKADEQYQAYTDYINCIFLRQALEATASPFPIPYECNDSVDSKVSFPLWFIVCFNEAGQGLLLFLLYGTSVRFFKTWYYLFTNPKRLWSSKYSSTDGNETTKVRTVAGRRVTAKTGDTGSKRSQTMMDDLDDDETSDASTTTTATTTDSEGEGEIMEMEDMTKEAAGNVGGVKKEEANGEV